MRFDRLGLFLLPLSILVLSGCPGVPTGPVAAGSSLAYAIDPGSSSTVRFTVDIGASPADVYLTLSNPTASQVANPVVVRTDGASASLVEARTGTSGAAPAAGVAERAAGSVGRTGRPGRIDVTLDREYRNTAPAIEFGAADAPVPRGGSGDPVARAGASDTVGDRRSFFGVNLDNDGGPSPSVPATNRLVRTVDGATLSVWVADDSWAAGGTKTHLVTQTMVDQLADYFLRSGAANDIYDWTTNILGEPWGPHNAGNLIGDDDSVTILLYDIQGDDIAPLSDGGAFGLFFSRDNRVRASGGDSESNERVMFYLDSVMLASPEGSSWSIDDWAPAEIVSTLAHEFQHMIHFYQKQVSRRILSQTDTWVEEMMSMFLEDLLSDKIEKNGPRGVPWNDGSAGSPGIRSGRLPRFNLYPDESLALWGSSSERSTSGDVFVDYALSYSFGAYLGRNYGGARLLHAMMDNAYTRSPASNPDEDIILAALRSLGYYTDMPTLLRLWSQAVLLSDDTSMPVGLRFNSGGYFSEQVGGVTYRLGSINFYNYVSRIELTDGSQVDVAGPFVHQSDATFYSGGQPAYGTYYYRVGRDLTGRVELEVRLANSDQRLGVLVKR